MTSGIAAGAECCVHADADVRQNEIGNLAIHDMDGEGRILDLDVALRLGYARPTKIRELIKRHQAALEKLGTLPTVGRVLKGARGSTVAEELYLNRRQALFIVTKADTAEAITATVEIVRRFDAYERGEVVSPNALDRIVAEVERRLQFAPITVDQMVDQFERRLLARFGMVPEQIGTLDGKVDQLLSRVAELAMNRRVTIPANVVMKHIAILQEDGGNCPCCKKAIVYRSESAKAVLERRGQAWEADHFFANMSANFEHTWIICLECHNLLTPWRPGPTIPRIGSPTRKFEGYHEGAREILKRLKRGEDAAEASRTVPLFAAAGQVLEFRSRPAKGRQGVKDGAA